MRLRRNLRSEICIIRFLYMQNILCGRYDLKSVREVLSCFWVSVYIKSPKWEIGNERREEGKRNEKEGF